MNYRSIRVRLTFWYTSILFLLFTISGILVYFGFQNYLQLNMENALKRRADQIGESLLSKMDEFGEAYVKDKIEVRFISLFRDRFIRISYPNNEIFYISTSPKDQTYDSSKVPYPGNFKDYSTRIE